MVQGDFVPPTPPGFLGVGLRHHKPPANGGFAATNPAHPNNPEICEDIRQLSYCMLPILHWSLPIVCDYSLSIRYFCSLLLAFAYGLLPIAYCLILLSFAYCALPVTYRHLLPIACCLLPIFHCCYLLPIVVVTQYRILINIEFKY